MAKNRNKKKKTKNGPIAMDVFEEVQGDAPQAMDTSEGKPSNPSLDSVGRKIKKGTPMKRSKNLRKLKAAARAVLNSEKSEEKLTRNKSKALRVQSAKSLYD